MKIFCTFQFEAQHRWADAPDQYAVLRSVHRHIFHGRATVSVTDHNREVEFIELGRRIKEWCEAKAKPTMALNHHGAVPEQLGWSCEHWAHAIRTEFGMTTVEISEDGENGAIAEYNDL